MTDVLHSGRAAFPPPASRALPELRRFALFLAVGAVGLAIDCALFSELSGSGLPTAGARALSLAAAMGATWWLNRTVTFAASARTRSREALRYAAVTLLAQGFSFGLFLALTILRPALPPTLALVAGAVAAAGLSFAGQRLFTFRPA